jgi:hypothetical protein
VHQQYSINDTSGKFSTGFNENSSKVAAGINYTGVGLATEFRSEKIPRNSLGTDSVIPRKKVLIPTEFRIPRKSPFQSSKWNGTEFREKIAFRNSQKNDLFVAQKSSFLAIFLKFVAAAFCCQVHCYQVSYFRPA